MSELLTESFRRQTGPTGAGSRATVRRHVGVLAPAVLIAPLILGHPLTQAAEGGDPEYKQWSERLTAAAARHDAAEEVLCATTIGRRWNWALITLPHALIEQAARESELARLGESRIELLQMLYEIRWRHKDGSEPSRWWGQLSLSYLEHNRRQEAFAVAAHITDPYALIALQADNRYRAIARSAFVERDILKATEKDLERAQSAADLQPRDLGRVVAVARALMRLHRYQEVLQLTGAVLEREAAAAPGSPRYGDLARELPWVYSARGYAFGALGRPDEAVTQLRRASQESKDGVSHALNLASFLAELDLPQEAVAAIPPLEKASDYGKAVAAMVRVKAASELDDRAALDAGLDDLRKRAQTYPGTFELALIVAGRDEEAAATLLARLADPDERSDALVELQDYAEHPAPPQVIAWRKRLAALRERTDVRRAIKAYGRIGSYAVPGVGF